MGRCMRSWTRGLGALVVAGAVVGLGALEATAARRSAGSMSADEVMKRATSVADIDSRLSRYALVELGAAPGAIHQDLVPLLTVIKRTADALDRVYWAQMWPEGPRVLAALDEAGAGAAKVLADLLRVHYGPWDRHANDEAFLDRRPRPAGAAFYPSDTSRREIDHWLDEHPEDLPAFLSPTTRIERKGSKLVAVPYSKAYARELGEASTKLKEAAGRYTCDAPPCPCTGLSRFFTSRAAAFLSDDYRESDVQWVEAGDCPLDVAIGPYEVYDDRLMGMKAAFGAIVYYRDETASGRYSKILEKSDALAEALPIDAGLRGRFLATRPSPITVGDILYTAGDARAGLQVRAFILPNDPTVRGEHGTKNVILRNVARAKFDKLVKPIAQRVLSRSDAKKVTFNAYFDFLVAWQMAHGLTPREIVVAGGKRAKVSQQLRERFALVDAVKGEAVALLNYLALLDQGEFKKGDARQLAFTYLANLFDTLRLAEGTTHSMAKVVVYNHLARQWAFRYHPSTRTFQLNAPGFRPAVEHLVDEVLQILGRGDYDGAGRLIVQNAIVPGEVRQKLSELESVPLEIRPHYISMP